VLSAETQMPSAIDDILPFSFAVQYCSLNVRANWTKCKLHSSLVCNCMDNGDGCLVAGQSPWATA